MIIQATGLWNSLPKDAAIVGVYMAKGPLGLANYTETHASAGNTLKCKYLESGELLKRSAVYTWPVHIASQVHT